MNDGETTLGIVLAFNRAFGAHRVDELRRLLTEDTVFENTYPPPEGKRYEGIEDVSRFWEDFFRTTPSAAFTAEDVFACGDRAVVLWRYDWHEQGAAGHVRGVDVFRVRDGKVAEKLSYVKG